MSTHNLIISGIMVLVVGVGGGAYIGHVDGKLEAAEEIKKQTQQIIADADARIAERDKALAGQTEKLEAEKNALTSAADAIKVMARMVPNLAGTVTTVAKEKLPTEVTKDLPDAPSYTVMPEATAVAMGKRLLTCQENELALGTCQSDLQDRQAQFEAASLSSRKWEEAAKGGSKWARLKKVGLFTAAAGGGAAIGGTKGSQGAAIGAAGGVIICSIFCK